MKSALCELLQEIGACLFILLGAWCLIAIYAIAHDQYIVRIAPEHFTVHHHGFNSGSAEYQALLYAAFASVGPGILYGTMLAVVCRIGNLKKFSPLQAFYCVGIVLILAECASLLTGLFVTYSGQPLYPVHWYPDVTLELYITRSIQITCYLVSAAGAIVSVLLIPFIRKPNTEPNV